jgi:hypothetical protein
MAMDNKLAVDEVAFNILREYLSESEFVYDCDHSSVQYSKPNTKVRPIRHSKPYCTLCYSRLEKTDEKRAFRGRLITQEEFRPIETFIDRHRKERSQKAKDIFEARVNVEVKTRVNAELERIRLMHKGEVFPID